MTLRLRSEVPVQETWDLTGLFADEAAFDQAMETASERCVTLERSLENPIGVAQDLLALIHQQDQLLVEAGLLSRFAMSKFAEDATNADSQARMGRVSMLSNSVAKVCTDLQTVIVSLPEETLAEWGRLCPALAAYAPYLRESTNGREYRLSDDVEAALAQFTSAFHTATEVYQAAMGGDIAFQSVTDSHGEEVSVTPFYMLTTIETSPDTKLRKAAYQSMTKGLRPYQHTLAKSLGGHIQRQVTESKMRGYPTVLHMLQQSSGRGLMTANGVNPEHFFMVQDTMIRELTPHMRRYMNLRKKVLGLDKPTLADVKATLESLDLEPISFDSAREIVLGAGRLLGDEYTGLLERAFNERWVYRARNQGNWNGAFCGDSDDHPYVFSPFGERLYDTFILGHELGHAVHLHLTYQNQLPSNRTFSNLFIETPSTLMEHTMARYLRQTNPSQVLMRRVNMVQLLTFHHNFVTHQSEAEILRRLYLLADAGNPLSTGVFKTISREVLHDFWGDTITLDEGADLYWMRQPHYYMGTYAYTYSVGLAASTVLSRRLATEGAPLMKAWIEVLKSGSKVSALELFAEVGLDMDSPEPYREAILHVGQLIDELEQSFQ